MDGPPALRKDQSYRVNAEIIAVSAAKTKDAGPVPVEQIGRSILVLRAHKVLLDEHLAAIYGVQTRVLIQAVKRNLARFPEDFMFQLRAAEWAALRSPDCDLKD